ncbi:protein AKNAD1 [Saccopteryx bilineata]|uniref:protein AKNAD1 n=1 Tax=Saccopteryx bilineata TaxID=59482 RepID=UPI00338FA7B6
MDEARFSEAGTSRRREDLPDDGSFSQTKVYDDHSFPWKDALPDVSDQTSSTAEGRQERATQTETRRNADAAPALDKTPECAVREKSDQEPQGTPSRRGPANRGDLAEPGVSGILQHDLSKEEFLKGPGINSETLPEISNADGFDEAVVKNIILRYVTSSWPQEQTPELADQRSPQRDGDSGDRAGDAPATTEGDASELGQPRATADSCRPESPQFLTKTKSPSNAQPGRQGQAPRARPMENTGAGPGVRLHRGHCRGSDLPAAAPSGNIPERDEVDQPLPTEKQASFAPGLRERLALVHNILESLWGPSRPEGAEQRRPTAGPVQRTETLHAQAELLLYTGPPALLARDLLVLTASVPLGPRASRNPQSVFPVLCSVVRTESETSLFRLAPTSQKGPSSSSDIFQKLSQGEKMCQELKEQTKQLESKVQEFSRSITQDSPCHVRDKRLVLEKVQGHLELLEQEFVANKEKHLTLQQRVHKHEPPAVSDFDPERKVEGGIFQLEMLAEDVEGNTEGRHTVASPAPASPPTTTDDLPPTSSPSSKETSGTGIPWELIRHCYQVQGRPRTMQEAPSSEDLVPCPEGPCKNTVCYLLLRVALPPAVCYLLLRVALPPAVCYLLLPRAVRAVTRIPLEDLEFLGERDSAAADRSQDASAQRQVQGIFLMPLVAPHGLPRADGTLCTFLRKQSQEERGHRRTSCGRSPRALPEQALHPDSMLSPAAGLGLPSNGRAACATKTADSPRGRRGGPPEEFHYRYNTPGQNYFSHSAGSPFVQLHFLNENKHFSPSCSKPNWIHSQTANSKSPQDAQEPVPGKKSPKAPTTCSSDLATPSPHSHPGRTSGSKPVRSPSSASETKPEGLSSSLDYALRTAMVLKETTDQMIRTITEDLAKVQRWRN